MIRTCALTKRFGTNEVLRGVDVDIGRGRVTGIVGPNGAGKTTLIKILLGLTRGDSGVVAFDGVAIDGDPSYRSRIGYMPQIAKFPENLTARELFALLRSVREHPRGDDETLIDRFGLREQLDKPLRVLSGGTRQKVNAVMAFLFDPDLLVLDEPTAGLDPAASALLKDEIRAERARGKAVIVTSHVMAELEELCDDIVFLLEGVVCFAGTVDELKGRTRQVNLERAVATMMIREVA